MCGVRHRASERKLAFGARCPRCGPSGLNNVSLSSSDMLCVSGVLSLARPCCQHGFAVWVQLRQVFIFGAGVGSLFGIYGKGTM